VDAAVTKILRVKFQLGLFENPFIDEETAAAVTNSAEHKALALEAAHKSMILLRNEGRLLPLEKSGLRSIAVIGPNAALVRLGGYSGDPGCGVSVLEGIRQKVGSGIAVLYAEGCGLTQSTNDAGQMWHDDEVLPPDLVHDTALIAEAVQAAEKADVTLLVLGDNEQTCREGWSVTHLGDRDSLDLPGRQDELLRAVVATGKPVILLLIQGRPASINFAAEHVPAILEGWYLGQAAGTAVADVLFGDVNPGGKLPITFPRSVGQLPAYYYHKPSARRGYLFTSKEPLFPFGHGLSYTTFDYGKITMDEMVETGEPVQVKVGICNTGSKAGMEVIQLYVRDVESSLPRPPKELKGFKKVLLQPGEEKEVGFTLSMRDLSYYDPYQKRWIAEAGEFEILIGASSRDVRARAKFRLINPG